MKRAHDHFESLVTGRPVDGTAAVDSLEVGALFCEGGSRYVVTTPQHSWGVHAISLDAPRDAQGRLTRGVFFGGERVEVLS